MSKIEFAIENSDAMVRTRTRLADTFGCPFTTWIYEDNLWRAVDSSLADLSSAEAQELECWFLRSVLGSNKPKTRTVGKKLYLAVSLDSADAPHCILVGHLEPNLSGLVERLATQTIREAESTHRQVEQDQLVSHYAQRLTDSFEELAFLRKLTQHVEHCVADRDLAQAAKHVLPQLRALLAVEGILLIEAGQRNDQPYARRILGSTGSIGNIESNWLQFVADLGSANQRGWVRNYAGDLHQGSAPWPGLKSVVSVPIQNNGVLYGWLIGINKQQSPYDRVSPSNSLSFDELGSMEASLLEAAAVMLGTHAGNNRLFQERESLIVDVVHTLVSVIEARDKYTCGHSDRVALIGRRLAKALGLPAHVCHEVFLSGLLHDIGKIAVPDHILLKPGKLTDEEFEQIKIHPVRGAALLRRLRPFENLIPGVLHHHEALDGSGYPHGLKGNAIPLIARILAVADSYDAMTSDRPYRQGMLAEKAESILREGAGRQWDEQVVDALFTVRDDIAKICKHWQRHLNQLLNPPENMDTEDAAEQTKLSAAMDAGWQNSAYTELPSFVRDVESMLIGMR